MRCKYAKRTHLLLDVALFKIFLDGRNVIVVARNFFFDLQQVIQYLVLLHLRLEQKAG